ncbi:hypothetical protein Chor_013181 [Crotalus horridus]
MTLFSWLLVLSLLFFWFWKSRRPTGFPTGPWRLPLLGNLLMFNIRDPLKGLDQLTKKYGPVFSLYLGGTPAVFIHGFLLAKEALMVKGIEFAGRPAFPLMDSLTKNKGLLTITYGEFWKEQRKFSGMLLRNFGMGKKSMEAKILEESTCLIQAFTENINVPFDPNGFLEIAVANIMSTILFGKHFEYDNSFLKTMLDKIHQNSRMLAGPWALIYNEVPLVRNLPLPHQEIFTLTKKTEAFFQKQIDEHKATMTPGEPLDFTDAYLKEIQKPERKGSSFEEKQLLLLLSNLFLAGTETMATTLQWTLLYLMAFPEVQGYRNEEWRRAESIACLSEGSSLQENLGPVQGGGGTQLADRSFPSVPLFLEEPTSRRFSPWTTEAAPAWESASVQ